MTAPVFLCKTPMHPIWPFLFIPKSNKAAGCFSAARPGQMPVGDADHCVPRADVVIGPYGRLTEALFSRPFALKARGKGDHRRWWKELMRATDGRTYSSRVWSIF